MSRYLVQFTALTTLRITESAEFGYGSTQVVVNNDATYDYSSAWPNRLAVCVETEADTIDSAIATGKEVAELTILLLVTSTSASTDICRFDRAIDYDSGVRDRLFRQEFPVPLSCPSTRELLPEKYALFHNALSNTENTLLSANIERFTRSIRWYRKGLLEEDSLDQYLNYWIALEILEPLLNKKYIIPKDRIEYPCEKCGYIKVSERFSHKGITRLVIETGYQETISKDIRSTRDKIIHGYEPFPNLIPLVKELLPILEKIVLSGILEILGISQDDRRNFLREPHYAPEYPTQTIEAIFADMPDNQLSHDSIPSIRISCVTTQIATSSQRKGSCKLKIDFPHPYSVKKYDSWIEHYQDPDESLTIKSEIDVQGCDPTDT